VLLTRRGNNLYVILYADPKGDAVKLKPLALLPRRATLLNTGAAIPCSLDLVPSEHGDQGRYLRLTKLPVNEHANTVLVAKLEFDHLPAVIGAAKESGASIL
jgi:alpha-L-fucosidase